MEAHPIPRQITTFEFKLVGFFTVKQFIEIVFFAVIGFVLYLIFPIPLVNIVVGVLVGAIGFALALLPYNERPLDEWIVLMFRRLRSPTQYIFHKNNPAVYFFNDLYFVSDPHRVLTHVESREKLAAYLARAQSAQTQAQPLNASTPSAPAAPISTGQAAPPSQSVPVASALVPMQSAQIVQPTPAKDHATPIPLPPPKLTLQTATLKAKEVAGNPASSPPSTTSNVVKGPRAPFLTGEVKNHKQLPIPGILVYLKDSSGKTLRLMKTNPHGIFATFNAVPPGSYSFELKDPRESYFFDTMTKEVAELNPIPLEFVSKELL